MSRSVDERVVEMRFENREFERGIAESTSSINKLKSSLNFDDNVKQLDKLEKAASDCDLNSLGDSANVASLGFQVLIGAARELGSYLGSTLISTINSAKKAIDSLTVDQIASGWSKYADKTTAVQTIMAATASEFEDTGTQMEYVNEQLDRLMWFTDETSYSFNDMVSNIGKFTSVGIGLEDAVVEMEGIATWAALSGAGVSGASRAMYNISQALGTGAMYTRDWMSIENANMATKEFKEIAIAAMEAVGSIQEGEVTIGNFREKLSEGIFTNEALEQSIYEYGKASVLISEIIAGTDITASTFIDAVEMYKEGSISFKGTYAELEEIMDATGYSAEELQEAFDKLASEEYELSLKAFIAGQEAKTFAEAIDSVKDAASSAWSDIFEVIFGDYERAKETWTTLSEELWDVFVGPVSGVRDVMSDWNDATYATANFTDAQKSLYDLWLAEGRNATGSFLSEAIRMGENVDDLISLFQKADVKVQNFDAHMEGPQAIVDGLMNLFHALVNIKNAISDAIGEVIPELTVPGLEAAAVNFRSITESILALFQYGDEEAETSAFMQGLYNSVRGIASVGSIIIKVIKTIWSDLLVPVGKLGGKAITAVLGGIGELGDKVHAFSESFSVDTLSETLGKFTSWLSEAASTLAPYADKAFGWVAETFTAVSAAAVSLWQTVSPKVEAAAGAIVLAFQKLFGIFKDSDEKIVDPFQKVDLVKKKTFAQTLSGILDAITERVSLFLDWFTGSVMPGFAPVINWFKEAWNLIKGTVTGIWESIKPVVTTIWSAFASKWQAFNDALASNDVQKAGSFLKDFGVSVAIAALGISKLVKSFSKSAVMTSIKESFASMSGIFDSLADSVDAVTNRIKASSLLAIAAAIGVLAYSFVMLSGVDAERGKQALIAMSVMFGELAALMLVISVSTWLAQGLSSAGSLVGMAVFVMAVGSAVKSIAKAVKSISSISDLESVKTGFKYMIRVIVVIGAFVTILAKTRLTINASVTSMMKSAGTLILMVSAGMYVIAKALAVLADVEDEDALTRGAVILGVFVSIIAAIVAVLMVIAKAFDENSGGIGGQLKNINVHLFGKYSNGLSSAIGAVASLVTSLGAAMLMFTAAIFVLDKIESPTAIENAAFLFMEIIAAIALTLGMITLIAAVDVSGNAFRNLLAMAVVLVAISATIGVLTGAVAELAQLTMDGADVSAATEAISMMMLLVTPILVLVVVGALIGPAMLASAAAFILFGIGMQLIATTLVTIVYAIQMFAAMVQAFSAQDTGATLIGIANVMLIMEAMKDIAWSMVWISLLSGSCAKAAVGILAIVKALGAFAALVEAVSVIETFTTGNGIEVIERMVDLISAVAHKAMSIALMLSVVSVLATPFIVMAIPLAAAITLVGVGMMAASSGLLMFTEAIDKLIELAPEFVPLLNKIDEAFGVMVDNFVKRIPQILKAFYKLEIGILETLTECIPKFLETLYNFVDKVTTALITWVPQIVDKLMDFLVAVINNVSYAIVNYGTEIADALENLFWALIDLCISILDGIFSIFGLDNIPGWEEAVEDLHNFTQSQMNDLGPITIGTELTEPTTTNDRGYSGHSGKFGEDTTETKDPLAVKDLLTGKSYYDRLEENYQQGYSEGYVYVKGYTEGMEPSDNEVQSAANSGMKIAEGFADGVSGYGLTGKEAWLAMGGTAEQWDEYMESKGSDAGTKAGEAAVKAAEDASSTASATSWLQSIVDQLSGSSSVTDTGSFDFSSFIGNMFGTDNEKIIESFGLSGIAGGESFMSSFTGVFTGDDLDISSMFGGLVGNIDGTSDISSAFDEEGTESGNIFTDSLSESLQTDENAEIVSTASSELGTAAVDGITSEEMTAEYNSAGEYIGEGLKEGLASKQRDIRNQAVAIAQEAVNGITITMQINSPSLVMKRLGTYAGEGFVLGLASTLGATYDTAETMGLTVEDAVNERVTALSEQMENNDKWTPRIRPILDLDEVESEWKALGNGTSKSISATVSTSKSSTASSNLDSGSDSSSTTTSKLQGVTFVQNNYSPTALSRADIYRQTNNQLKIGSFIH